MRTEWWLAAGAAALGVLVWHGARQAPMAAAPAPANSARPGMRIFGEVSAAPSGPGDRAARRRLLAARLADAERTYCNYEAGTRYPDSSRPLAEHPDQVYPNAPVTETHAMRIDKAGDGTATDAAVQIQTSQSRVFMGAGETVAFSLRAVDGEGRVLPLVVTRALAQGLTYGGARAAPQVALAFADDGQGADAQAGDGAFAAVLAPAQGGLAGFDGTIRTDVRYSAGGHNGFVLFDVIYSPVPPALWTGPPREVLEDGSLSYYLPAEIRTPGRYVVSARVDDAHGQPFALATFNEELGAGPQEIKLSVFGRLLRDQQPALPLTLRDVDAYLLREDTDPDRALMPRLEGKVLTGKTYPLTAFSGAEWAGEQRSRYLAEFARDALAARAALAAFDPAQDLPPGPCAITPP